MLRLCTSLPWIVVLPLGSVLISGGLFLLVKKPRRNGVQIDRNERLIIQLTFLGIFAVLSFLVFVFTAWQPC